MEKITRHNYEAFFLDFAEGNLTEEMRAAVLDFIAANPDLKDELESFEIIEVTKEETSAPKWDALKKDPAHLSEELFFKSVENTLTETEQIILDELLLSEENRKAFAYWKKTVLQAGSLEISKDELYNTSCILPIGAHNYTHFLIASGEGLLNANELEALNAYAATQPNGARELKYYASLKLEAPRGIFYPDKKALYHKENKGFAWWYSAAAIAVLVVMGALLFNVFNTPEQYNPRMASQQSIPELDNKDIATNEVDSLRIDSIKVERITPIEEWEMREPDPVFVAEELEHEDVLKGEQTENQPILEMEMEAPALAHQDRPELEATPIMDPKEEVNGLAQIDPQVEMPEHTEAKENNGHNQKPSGYRTIPEYTEDVLASKLDMTEEEKDQMALAIAKRITDKAASMLDSEIKKEESNEGDQMTYTLRIRNFKIKHSRNR